MEGREEPWGKGMGWCEHPAVLRHRDPLKAHRCGHAESNGVWCVTQGCRSGVAPCPWALGAISAPPWLPMHPATHPLVSRPPPRCRGAHCWSEEVAKGHCLLPSSGSPSGQGVRQELGSSRTPIAPDQAATWDPAHVCVGHGSPRSTLHLAEAWCPPPRVLTQ